MFDVAIVGAGPAGSTAAALLAEAGHRVRVYEREHFPRFHIGESLLPAELAVFDRLGVDVASLPSLYKSGADFLDESTGDFGRFPFAEGLPGTAPHSYQVERAPFDALLAKRAAELGADVRFGVRVRSVTFEDDGVTLHGEGFEDRARYVLDATGRDRLLSRQHKSFQRIEGLGIAAVGGHFEGLSEGVAAELAETGNLKVLMIDEGWGWVIPLTRRRLSVGFVSAKRGVVSEAWWQRCVDASPLLTRLTEGATRGPLATAGDFSFRNTQPYGARFCCIGDASAFLDPIFSSGVAFAMDSAVLAADLLAAALERDEEDQVDLMAPVSEKMSHAYEVFAALIDRFYHRRLVQNFFFYDHPDPQIRAGLISVLAGDVWRDDNPFQDMLLRSRRRRPLAELAVEEPAAE